LAYSEALEAVLRAAGSAVQPWMQEVFKAILHLKHTEAGAAATRMLELLAASCGFSSVTALFSLQLPHMLPQLIGDYQRWEAHSQNRFAFQALVVYSGEAIKDFLETVIDVLAANCTRDKDVEVKADMLIILDTLVADARLHPYLKPICNRIFREVITPVCQWKPGTTSAKIRKGGLVCLMNLLKYKIPAASLVASDWAQIFPSLSTCMEDDYDPDLRYVGCRVMEQLLQLCLAEFSEYCTGEVCVALRKRLDDSKDYIRVEVCKSFQLLFQIGKRIGRFGSYRDVLRVLFLHLDDPNDDLSRCIYTVLSEASAIDPADFLSVGEEALGKQKRQQAVKELLALVRPQ